MQPLTYADIKKRAHHLSPDDPRLAPIGAYPKCSRGDNPKARITIKRIKELHKCIKGSVPLCKNGIIQVSRLKKYWGVNKGVNV